MKKIVVIGSGGFAKEVAFLIEDINKKNKEWEFLGFIDQNSEIGSFNGKYQVYQHDKWLEEVDFELYVVFGIGTPNVVKKIVLALSENSSIKFPNLIHPNVVGDWERIQLGQGNIVCAGNIFTTDIEIGSFNVFNLDCTIGHDTIIGDYNVINPSVNISGGVQIKGESLIGTGAQILQYLSIVPEVIVGAGALVVKNIDEKGVYVGAPAKKLIR